MGDEAELEQMELEEKGGLGLQNVKDGPHDNIIVMGFDIGPTTCSSRPVRNSTNHRVHGVHVQARTCVSSLILPC